MIGEDQEHSTIPKTKILVPNGTSTNEESDTNHQNSTQSNDTTKITTDQVEPTEENNGTVVDNQVCVYENEEQMGEENDEFIRITAAHQMLTEGKNELLFFSSPITNFCSTSI
jgi:hypothetical protein